MALDARGEVRNACQVLSDSKLTLTVGARRKLVWHVLGIVALLATVRPSLNQDRIYWGDMHGHTAISDGKGSLD